MKLLFVQGGTRIKKDDKENFYTDGNFNLKVWKRYMDLTDEKMTVVFREDSKKYSTEEAKKHLNYFDSSQINSIILPDLYSPKKNFISVSKRNSVKKKIEKAVSECDCVIIRSLGNLYVNYAINAAEKYSKPYLVEVTGVYWDNSWYHSFLGKVLAPQRELSAIKAVKNAPYVVYVTEKALQKRYPNKGKNIGCSDVELISLNDEVIESREKKIKAQKGKIILGTAGFVNLKTKGQHDVIKALGELKKQGITGYEYQLIGLGDESFLRHTAKKYDVENQVVFLGGKTHEEVFKWLDNLDIYVQPSYQEGLCRSIVEAMSRACPVICSNAGGNDELVSSEFVFHRGNVKKLIACLRKMDKKEMLKQAEANFSKSKHYDKQRLDKIRNDFYSDFIKNAEGGKK